MLRDLASQAKQIVADAGAIAIKDNWRNRVRTIRPVINTENARRLGLIQDEISNGLHSHLTGSSFGVYREGDELLSIVMRPFERDRDDMGELRIIQVFS